MKDNQLNEFIDNYIQNDKTNCAIMITSPWGTGKSYYVQTSLVKHLTDSYGDKRVLSRSVIVVSLYGLKTISEVSKCVYLQCRFGKTGKRSELSTVGSTAVQTLISSVLSLRGIDITISDSKLEEIYESIDLSERILVFEDLERTDIELTEFLGYVNNLTEHDKAKVILIANEDEIILKRYSRDNDQNNDSDKKGTSLIDDYYRIKEKTISDTIHYECDYPNAIDSILRRFSDTSLKRILSIESEDIGQNVFEIMVMLRCYNLRSFIFACQKTAEVFNLIQIDERSKEFALSLFYSIVAFSLRYKRGDNCTWQGEANYSFRLGVQRYPLFLFCYNYIYHHIVEVNNGEELENIFQKMRMYDNESRVNDPDVQILDSFVLYSEKDVHNALSNINNRLTDLHSIPFFFYGRIASSCFQLKEYLGIKKETSEILEKLIDNVNGRGDEVSFDSITSWPFQSDNDEIQKEYRVFYKRLYHSLISGGLIEGFDYSEDQVDSFVEYVVNNHSIIYSSNAFAAKLNSEKLATLFLSCSPMHMSSIRKAFNKVYEPINAGEYLINDIENLSNIRDRIKEGLSTKELDKIQRLHCNRFITEIQDIIKRLDPSRKSL